MGFIEKEEKEERKKIVIFAKQIQKATKKKDDKLVKTLLASIQDKNPILLEKIRESLKPKESDYFLDLLEQVNNEKKIIREKEEQKEREKIQKIENNSKPHAVAASTAKKAEPAVAKPKPKPVEVVAEKPAEEKVEEPEIEAAPDVEPDSISDSDEIKPVRTKTEKPTVKPAPKPKKSTKKSRNDEDPEDIDNFKDLDDIDPIKSQESIENTLKEYEGKPSKMDDPQKIDEIKSYLQDIGKVKLLSPAEEELLVRQLMASKQAEKDMIADVYEHKLTIPEKMALNEIILDGKEASVKLINCNLRLVIPLAKKNNYGNQSMKLLDLIAEGNKGLNKAIDKFDTSHGVRFSTYATWWIRQAITRASSTQSRTIRLPVHIVDSISKVNKTKSLLFQRLHRDPTTKEITDELIANNLVKGVTEEKVIDWLTYNRPTISINDPIGDDDGATIADIIKDKSTQTPEEAYMEGMKQNLMNDFLVTLSAKQRIFITLKYVLYSETEFESFLKANMSRYIDQDYEDVDENALHFTYKDVENLVQRIFVRYQNILQPLTDPLYKKIMSPFSRELKDELLITRKKIKDVILSIVPSIRADSTLSLEQIGILHGCTRETVRQVIDKGLKKLKNNDSIHILANLNSDNDMNE